MSVKMVKLSFYLIEVLLVELFFLCPVKLEINNNASSNHASGENRIERQSIQIKYGTVEVIPNGVICSNFTTNVPAVTWEADSTVSNDVLIMFDEKPASDELSQKSRIHFLVVDIPRGELDQGRVVAPYCPPEPTTKDSHHRSIAIRIYRRDYPITVRKLNDLFRPKNSRSLDVASFAEDFQLKDPVFYQSFLINFDENCQ